MNRDQERAVAIACEGATDRFCGRPREHNPYSQLYATTQWEAWFSGWDHADFYLDLRGAQETARWLQEAV